MFTKKTTPATHLEWFNSLPGLLLIEEIQAAEAHMLLSISRAYIPSKMFSIVGKNIHNTFFCEISELCFTHFTLLFSGRNQCGMKLFRTPIYFRFQTSVAIQNMARNIPDFEAVPDKYGKAQI